MEQKNQDFYESFDEEMEYTVKKKSKFNMENEDNKNL